MGWQRYLLTPLLLLAIAQAADMRAASAVLYQPEQDTERVPRQPFFRFFTGDRFERRIVFYVSEEPDSAAPMPLVAYIQGSGATSLFVAEGDAVSARHGLGTVADVLRGRARLIVVEKPGVEYLDDPRDEGGVSGSSEAFRREHTLERWVEAVYAALAAARKLPEVRAGKSMARIAGWFLEPD